MKDANGQVPWTPAHYEYPCDMQKLATDLVLRLAEGMVSAQG